MRCSLVKVMVLSEANTRHVMRSHCIAMLMFVSAAFGCPATGITQTVRPGLPQKTSYISEIDGSRQEYGIYVPSVAAPPGGYPAVMHTHGYGWNVSTGFSDWQRQWAETHGWVIINLNARGPQFYEGIGEVATLEVVRDATARFRLDADRIYIVGASMGGTGAFRHGVRYPYVFAAAVGVDGWTDYRLWHHHWYARTDYRDYIEEFRRPLLQEASPLYWARRGQWGAVKAVVDGKDTVVWPDNGLQLYARMAEFGVQDGSYDVELALNYSKGHGGGFDIADSYSFFLERSRIARPTRFHCATYLLSHASMYWGRIDVMRRFGLLATLDAAIAGNVVSVKTGNLSRFTLHLDASPLAGATDVALYADGFKAYSGPAHEITLKALYSAAGQLIGWQPDCFPPGFAAVKSPELPGLIGDVFTRPFTVVYGTAGNAEMTAMHRAEAEAFCKGWRAFMIRQGSEPDALGPYPEDQLPPAFISDKSLLIFGARETSNILATTYSMAEVPVVVGDHYVTVAASASGEMPRTYYGDNFGAFVCYPSPLAGNRHYILAARGRWFTKPDGTVPQALEYDMEKLPWGYPDYVIFNTDQSQLPHVLNVNDKPPVTCYEAGYFVEAGYFDATWHIDRAATLDRVLADVPSDIRFIHVDDVQAVDYGVRVRILDASGKPVSDARVTVTWPGERQSASAVTDAFGWANRTGPAASYAAVTSVMATGCVYDFRADTARSTADAPLRMTLGVPKFSCDISGDPRFSIAATLRNCSSSTVTGTVAPLAFSGRWRCDNLDFTLAPGQKTILSCHWYPASDIKSALPQGADPIPLKSLVKHPALGSYPLTLTAEFRTPPSVGNASAGGTVVLPDRVSATADVELELLNLTALAVEKIEAPSISEGQPWKLTCTLKNRADAPVMCELAVGVVPAGDFLGSGENCRYLAPRKVTVPAKSLSPETWNAEANAPVLPVGLYEAVVYCPEHPELGARVPFSVKPSAE